MPLVYPNLVCERTSTLGQGDLVLTGAVSPNFTFAAKVADGAQFYYRISEGSKQEGGEGTYRSATNRIERTTVKFSSAGGTTKITLTTGRAKVWVDVLGEYFTTAGGSLISGNNLSDVANVSTSRANLGLASMALQAAGAVAITGGTISGAVITIPGNLLPETDDLTDIGSTAKKLHRIFFATGAVINFGAGNVTWTHGNGFVTQAGGYLYLSGTPVSLYTAGAVVFRGAISDDTNATLTISGGTNGSTTFGTVNATSFVGALTGNVTGNVSGSSGSCTGNAATASAVAVGGIAGLGTGVATALAINVGSAGAFVTFNGAGGTPSSITLTNATGTAAGLTAGNATLAATVTTNANLIGPITSVGNATAIASQTGTGTTFAMSASPGFTGTPTSPTAAAGTNTTQVSTTEYVMRAVGVSHASLLVCDGNSLTRGFPESVGLTYPDILRSFLGSGWSLSNLGVDGQTTEAMLADAVTQVDPLYNAGNARNIVIAWPCLQSITGGDTAAALYAVLTTYIQGRQAAGFYVVAMTMIKWGTASGGQETIRQAFNALVNANAAGANRVVDLAADARLANTADTTFFYTDTVHMTAHGYAVVAELVAAGLYSAGVRTAFAPGDIVSSKVRGDTTNTSSVLVLEATKVIVEGSLYTSSLSAVGQGTFAPSSYVTGLSDMLTGSGLVVTKSNYPDALAFGIESTLGYPVIQALNTSNVAIPIYLNFYGGDVYLGASNIQLATDKAILGNFANAGSQANKIIPYDAGGNLVIDHRHTSAGAILFQQAGTTAVSIDIGGNLIVGTAALATNATNGFPYIQTCVGTPTGTPATVTGRVPVVYDSTNDILYIFRGSWKKAVANIVTGAITWV